MSESDESEELEESPRGVMIREAISCEICFNPFTAAGDRVPLNLPCGHCFCSSCVRQFNGLCPNDRTFIGSIDKLSRNFHAMKLLASVDALPAAQSTRLMGPAPADLAARMHEARRRIEEAKESALQLINSRSDGERGTPIEKLIKSNDWEKLKEAIELENAIGRSYFEDTILWKCITARKIKGVALAIKTTKLPWIKMDFAYWCDDNIFQETIIDNGNLTILRYLLENGLESWNGFRLLPEHYLRHRFVTLRNMKQESPLNLAAEKGNFDVVQYLLHSGGDKKRKKRRSYPEEALDYRIEPDMINAALAFAATSGCINTAALLVSFGAVPDSLALMNAVKALQVRMVRFLLEKGANPSQLVPLGRTLLPPTDRRVSCDFEVSYEVFGIPLHEAVNRREYERREARDMIKLLVHHGADVTVKDSTGKNAHEAAERAVSDAFRARGNDSRSCLEAAILGKALGEQLDDSIGAYAIDEAFVYAKPAYEPLPSEPEDEVRVGGAGGGAGGRR